MAKRRANGEGTIRKRGDGRWEARYRDPKTGKQHSIYGKTQGAVRDKLKNVQKEIDKIQGVYNPAMTVDDWFAIWFERYLDNIKPLTYDSYTAIYANHIKPYIGDKILCELDVDTIQILYRNLFQGTKNKQGLSAKTVKNVHGVIHKSLEQALRNKYITSNPTSYCVLPKVFKKDIHPLNEKDIKPFLQAIKGTEYEDIYLLALFTGMRQGEVLGLTWDNIDFTNGIITISKQLQKGKYAGAQYFLGTLKNNKARAIAPSDYIMQMLQRHKLQQDTLKKQLGDEWCGDELSNDFVFTTPDGRHLSHNTVYKNYKAIVKQMNLDTLRFHDLRHSYAVIALQNGDDIKTVQETLGHHAAAFTLDVYGHVTQKMKKDSAKRMDNFIAEIN